MINKYKQSFDDSFKKYVTETDNMFAVLLAAEWIVAILVALFVSPRTWAGTTSSVHIHVYAAIFLGGLLSLYPIYKIVKTPGSIENRYIATISQTLFSILFVHLTGGRIETHFHIFVSFAFFSFYLDWRVLVIPTLITVVDHMFRGYYFPESIYGVASASLWRAGEHSAWVAFEDVVIFYAIQKRLHLLRNLTENQVKLADALETVEEKVIERTRELLESRQTILNQQHQIVSSSKMSALGEMAGGIAHEINNPLAVINMFTEQIGEELESEVVNKEEVNEIVGNIEKTVDRIARIISGLRSFARDGSKDPLVSVNLKQVIDETLTFCGEKIKKSGVQLTVVPVNKELSVMGRSTEISQVILNLLNNAYDAISKDKDRWIKIEVKEVSDKIQIYITDSGHGIPKEFQDHIFEPFFTTKDIGKGTGMGLSISAGIIKSHEGSLSVDNSCPNTKFVIELNKGRAS